MDWPSSREIMHPPPFPACRFAVTFSLCRPFAPSSQLDPRSHRKPTFPKVFARGTTEIFLFRPLRIERPYCIANFVSTLDGVVSFNLPGQSEGAQISDSNEEDRFIMGLLRASADAVMVGSGTLQAAGPQGSWLPEAVYPAAKDLYQEYRTEVLRKPEYPLVVIVTGTGGLDLASAVFHTPRTRVLILTTEQGKQRLSQSGSEALASVEVKALSTAEKRISPSAILTLLRQEAGVELLLHEAGPTLFGEFLAGGFMDELFLTVAPQIAGQSRSAPQAGPGCERSVLSRDGSLVEASQRKKRSRLSSSSAIRSKSVARSKHLTTSIALCRRAH